MLRSKETLGSATIFGDGYSQIRHSFDSASRITNEEIMKWMVLTLFRELHFFFKILEACCTQPPSPRNVMRRTFDALGAKLASKSEVEVLWEVSLLVLPNTPNRSLWQPSAIVYAAKWSSKELTGRDGSLESGVSETSTQGAEIYALQQILCSCLFWLYSYMVV